MSLRARLEWTAERLAEERPDLVLLQEASVTAQHGNTAGLLDNGEKVDGWAFLVKHNF